MDYQAKKYELSCRNCLGYHSEKKRINQANKIGCYHAHILELIMGIHSIL